MTKQPPSRKLKILSNSIAQISTWTECVLLGRRSNYSKLMYIVANSDALPKPNYFYATKIIGLALNSIYGIIFLFVSKMCYSRKLFHVKLHSIFCRQSKFVFSFTFSVRGRVTCGKKGVFVKAVRFSIEVKASATFCLNTVIFDTPSRL